jgi:PiT family inorganic phosphate transporter
VVITILLVSAAVFLAFSNGANDNFKGVASLYGSGVASYRAAITWATVTTAAGSLASFFLAEALLHKFTGKGLVPDALTASQPFILAVAAAAALTVILATRFGFPISTTHALLGAMGGAGIAFAGPGALALAALAKGFVLPLVLGPVLAVGLGALAFFIVRSIWGLEKVDPTCICVALEETAPQLAPAGAAAFATGEVRPVIVVESAGAQACAEAIPGPAVGIDSNGLLDGLHWSSAGAVSFARGLNDTPKMAALLLIVHAIAPAWDIAVVGLAIAIGGVLGARRVAETMSHKITVLSPTEGLVSNLSTATLVFLASFFGLPVSTTHVSVGSLYGIALTKGSANHRTIQGIVLSWVVTLPVAALLGALIALLLGKVLP